MGCGRKHDGVGGSLEGDKYLEESKTSGLNS